MVLDNLYIESTPTTPEVDFNKDTGKLSISGRSIPEDAKSFWSEPAEWLFNYISLSKSKKLELNINLDYFNISSSKMILTFLYRLNDYFKSGADVKITWNYKEEDEDMFEVGKDYEHMINIPFEFVEIKEKLFL
jgi:hypothetical protein